MPAIYGVPSNLIANVGIDTTSPLTALHVSTSSTATLRGILSAQYNSGTQGAQANFYKARGTETSPLTLVTADFILEHNGWGHDGSNYLLAAQTRYESTGTIASTRMPGRIVWATATDAAPSVLTDRMWLSPLGNLLVGTSTDTTGSGSLSVTGKYLTSGTLNVFDAQGATTSARWFNLQNTGSRILFGVESSGGGSIITGSSSYAAAFTSGAAVPIQLGINFNLRYTFTDTGLGILTSAPGSFGLAVNHATGSCLDLIYNDSDGSPANHCSLVVSSGGNLTITPTGNQTIFSGTIIGAVQLLSGAGAINVTQLITEYTSNGVAQALTLANGTVGQIKKIVHTVDGGSGVLTPTTPIGYTTITFTNVGDAVDLLYTTTGWAVTGSKGSVIA